MVSKPVRDTVYQAVSAHRYECLRCRRTFRVYPQGVSQASTSQRVKGLAVMLYLLGLSYGAVALALEALGAYLCKSQVYEAVQATAKKVPGLKRRQMFGGVLTPALGADVTSVKCRGKWLPLGLTVDSLTGLVLSVDRLPNEEAQTLETWLAPIAAAVDAQLLVSDDADGFKSVADHLGLEQQICKNHVKRNTDALVESLTPSVRPDSDGSLAALGVAASQAVADVTPAWANWCMRVNPNKRWNSRLCKPATRVPAHPGQDKSASQPSLSLAPLFVGALEPVGTPHTLPHLARCARQNPGWHQQCQQAGDRLVDQRTLPLHAGLQAASVCSQRSRLAGLVWQSSAARWCRLGPIARLNRNLPRADSAQAARVPNFERSQMQVAIDSAIGYIVLCGTLIMTSG